MDRILEINKSLPPGKKIRVISMSIGWSVSDRGYKEIIAAVDRARQEGIFVISACLDETYGIGIMGLGREPLKNPDDAASCEPSLSDAESFYNFLLSAGLIPGICMSGGYRMAKLPALILKKSPSPLGICTSEPLL